MVARLVAPYEYGVFTVALTVFSIAISFAELGVGFALVRERRRSREIAPTVFTLSLGNAVLLALVMVVFAPFLATAGGRRSAGAIRVLALFVLLSGSALCRRHC